MSTHSVKVVRIDEILPHDNADTLCIIPIGGWQCVARKDQFNIGEKAIYIEPDYIVPLDRDEFSFLKKPSSKDGHRLKAIRLRGALSFGLLITIPEDLKECDVDDCVMERLGITRYDPPAKGEPGTKNAANDALADEDLPDTFPLKFDIEDLRKHPKVFREGEKVVVTEKIHGANARFLFQNGVFYIGSRKHWLLPESANVWTRVARETPAIEAWCRDMENYVLYGEAYGPVQDLQYGLTEPKFAAFAAQYMGNWLDLPVLFATLNWHGVPHVKEVYRGDYWRDKVSQLAEMDSLVESAPEGHMMEGVVITPIHERRNNSCGRAALKLISNRYWLH